MIHFDKRQILQDPCHIKQRITTLRNTHRLKED